MSVPSFHQAIACQMQQETHSHFTPLLTSMHKSMCFIKHAIVHLHYGVQGVLRSDGLWINMNISIKGLIFAPLEGLINIKNRI